MARSAELILPPELILMLAEYMSIVTLQSFKATNKTIFSIISSYENSIVRAKTSTFLLPPLGHVLSSADHVRRVCRADSFPLALELERRETRIDILLGHSPSFLDLAGPPGLDPLTVTEQSRLAHLLKRALYHCDRISDLAANDPTGDEEHEDGGLIRSDTGSLYCRQMSKDGGHAVATGTKTLLVRRPSLDQYAHEEARGSQIRYLRSLEVDELAVLLYLVTACGVGFVRARKYEWHDPNVWEKITVFEECALRHGSWFLWAFVLHGASTTAAAARADGGGEDPMKALADHMILTGLAELTDWETGREDMQPGLRMSLLDAIAHKRDVDYSEVMGEVFSMVGGMVMDTRKGGDDDGEDSNNDEQNMRA